MTDDYGKHLARLRRAQKACASREAWVPFEESPSRRLHPDGALENGRAAFDARLGSRFEIPGVRAEAWIGDESSPYTRESLGITYPEVSPDRLFAGAAKSMKAWRRATAEARVGVCMEILDRLAANVFENAYATMHTSGQAFMMAFAGSGANSLDRGLEALAFADLAMSAVPQRAVYEREFGGRSVRLEKRYRLMPRGVALVITCGSYPAWNAYPSIFANLSTGNAVIVKPHPHGVLPMAIAVSIGREVLAERGFDPDLLTLAVDRPEAPIAKDLIAHDDCAIIDFTGSQRFGQWIENEARRALVYTETSGCNAVVLESTDDAEAMFGALAQGVALFSAQMCTAPQNMFVPADGIATNEGQLSFDEVCARLAAAIDEIAENPSVAAAVCGALHKDETVDALSKLTAVTDENLVVRRSSAYPHPEFPNARTATPLVVKAAASSEIYRREHFGPVAFMVSCKDAGHALERATEDARFAGSIANYLYSTDPDFLEAGQDAFADAGASVGCNLRHQRPINFTAAFSDYHVTGLNPAGNASLTDMAFVASRFRIVQSKVEVG